MKRLHNACPECGADMVLRNSAAYSRLFYGCVNYPECKATHGAHPDGRPLGVPANKETKQARIKAHEAMAEWMSECGLSKSEAYAKLAESFGTEIHIAECDIEGCEKVTSFCNDQIEADQ